MVDLEHELKVADEFWDFLGGTGAYQDLLGCFERVGIELGPEIDQYFAKFNSRRYLSSHLRMSVRSEP